MKPTLEFTEQVLVSKVADWLHDDGYVVWREVPNMGQSADIVAEKGNQVTILEAKLKDWKRALGQCRAHEAVADFIYIAVASKAVSPDLQKEAKLRGYGLLHFCRKGGKINLVLKAERNSRMWAPQRHAWTEQWKKLAHEN